MKTPDVLTVSQINFFIKDLIDGNDILNNVFIKGEISNFTNHIRTGHYYLTLKDEKSSIKAVMFRSNAQRIKFMPENGMSVIVRGRISVFERDGQYQLYIDDMQPDGIGSLTLAFEQLKQKLQEQGIFDVSHKKQIPKYPQTIGIITSPTGAAIRDILNILQRRFPSVNVIIYPVQVQGETAAPQIAEAIKKMSDADCADVLIVGRGGGSIEELWAFNEETVARAIYNCKIPIISAVGHETDFTISDFTADLRAPTPSAAAEMAVPERIQQKKYIKDLSGLTNIYLKATISEQHTRLNLLSKSNVLSNPLNLINNKRLILDDYINRGNNIIKLKIYDNKTKLKLLAGKLDTLSPLKVLSRGYCIAGTENKLIKSINDIDIGDKINIKMVDGIIKGIVKEKESEG